MAVAIVRTDSWVSHLPFVGGPRPSAFGPVDGIWYGLLAGDGDVSGGNFSLSGNLSFDRKEDWIYVFGGLSTSTNQVTTTNAFTQVNTGPKIPTDATAVVVQNPSFSRGGNADPINANAMTVADLFEGGSDSRAGMPLFGDKAIPGNFLMIAAGWEVNTNGATYQLSSWGFLIRYNSFFRDRPPSVG